MSYQGLKTAAATAALMIGLLAHTGVTDARSGSGRRRLSRRRRLWRWISERRFWRRRFPWRRMGRRLRRRIGGGAMLGGGGFRAAARRRLVRRPCGGGWGGRHWGGDGGGWGSRHWGYHHPWHRAYWGGWPWYGAGLIGAGWPYYPNVGYYGDSCYRLRRVWTDWGWRRQWVNVCDGWGYSGLGRLRRLGRRLGLGLVNLAFPRTLTTSALPVRDKRFRFRAQPWRGSCGAADADNVYKLILDLTDGVSWPLSLQAALLSSTA